MRLIVKSLGIALLALVAILLAAFGLLQTPPGKALLASLGSSLASSDGMKVEISGITGFVPFDMGVGTIEVADSSGRFLGVDELHLSWRPLALLAGRLDVTSLTAARVELERLPELPPSEPAPAESSSFGVPIRLESLSIPDIVLAEPVIGHAAQMSLNASADLSSLARGLSLTFALERRDEPGTVTGSALYAPEQKRLDLDIAAREPAGGLIARAAGIEGLPAIEATLKGSGPLDNWDGRLNLTAGDIAEAAGVAGIRATDTGHRITFALDADIARLLPENISPLFEGRTELAGTATMDDARNIVIDNATARSIGFGAAIHGAVSAQQLADLSFSLTAGDAARFSKLAPGAYWNALRLDGTLKGKLDAPALDARLDAQGLSGMGYGVGTLAATLRTTPDMAGNLAIALEGTAGGLSATDPQVASALGTSGRFSATGVLPSGGEPSLTAFDVQLAALTARFSGRADINAIDGDIKVERLDLAAFSALAGRHLAGMAAFDARVSATGDFSRASLDLNGSATGLETGIAQLDSLVGTSLDIRGALARNGENALSVSDLRIVSEGVSATVDGRIATDLANLKALLTLDDLARLDPRLKGALTADALFSGRLDDLAVDAKLRVPQGSAEGRPIRDLMLEVVARDLTGNIGGDFNLSGDIGGKPARGTATLATETDGTRRLSGLDLAIGSVTAKGDLAIADSGLSTGRIVIAAANIADLATLTLTEMAGRLNADIALDVVDGRQRAAVKADAAKLSAFGRTIGSADIDASLTDLFGIPLVNGTAALAGVDLDGFTIETASLNANGNANGTDMTLNALAQGINLRTNGRLERLDDGARLRLDRLNASRGNLSVATSAPATFTYTGGTLAIDQLTLAAQGGSATVSGTVGETLDLTVDLRALPLALANLASPGLNLSGTLAGNARIRGTAAQPSGDYRLNITRLNNPDLANAGAGPFDIATEGTLANGRANLRTTISGRNLQGFTVSGSVPLGAGELDLALRGAVNLALVNPLLATTGARVTGIANVDATVKGTASAPRAGGTVRLTNGRFDDAVNGVALDRIEAVITGTDRSVTLTSFQAHTTNGGNVSGRGNVTLDPAAGYPGRIDLTLTNAALVNSDLMRLVVDGPLGIEGAFLAGPRLTGRIAIRALDINIPDRLPGGVQSLNVRHINAGKRTTRPAKTAQRPEASANRDGIALDLVVSAPNNNVFVRGLGMEAQLGGEIRLSGNTRAPVALGAFEMRRGTFDFGGRRLTFTRGHITFTGNTDPELDFVAETTSNDITANVIVSGPASSPAISFTSTPSLPQDEVLSRLLFGRSAGTLNAGQALQIAQIVAQFSGGAGVLNNVRRSLGVDSLDIGTNEEGTGGQVGVGRRLNDNIYLGVKQGTTPNSSRVTVDVDLTRNIRLQGATGADGSAQVGIGAQWDY